MKIFRLRRHFPAPSAPGPSAQKLGGISPKLGGNPPRICTLVPDTFSQHIPRPLAAFLANATRGKKLQGRVLKNLPEKNPGSAYGRLGKSILSAQGQNPHMPCSGHTSSSEHPRHECPVFDRMCARSSAFVTCIPPRGSTRVFQACRGALRDRKRLHSGIARGFTGWVGVFPLW